MQLSGLDWAIIVGYFALALGVGLAFSRRAGRSLSEYFLSGRSLPWWIAGTSMVATTFAVDTPLAITEMTVKNGLAGNWFWWAWALGGMFTVFVYARLWRRAEVLTDVELVELRYGGKPAAFLRGFRSLYAALLINSIICGWVTMAMLKVLKFTVFADSTVADGKSDWKIIAICLGVVGVYSTLSGLWGVVVTDVIQFFLAMIGCVVLAVIAVNSVGGMEALQTKVAANFKGGEQAFRFLPDIFGKDAWMALNIFMLLLFVQWWATWYPGAEPGGGGYIVQRMASCKDERHSLLASLWFQIAHYCVRPWPWLIVAFVVMVLHPELRLKGADAESGYPILMRELAPAGLRGLMLVTFFAAFMSTISTQMNWGASYLVSDVYKRFFKPDASDRHYTRVSRIASILVLLLGGVVAWLMRDRSIKEAWQILLALGAGTGAVFMLRWFWWRINAWSEISAMVASLVFFVIVSHFATFEEPATTTAAELAGESVITDAAELAVTELTVEPDMVTVTVLAPEQVMGIVAGLTVVTWLLVTFLTQPESTQTLLRFYRKVRPGGPGWGPMAQLAPEVDRDRHLGMSIIAALVAGAIVYLTLPGVGLIIFGRYAQAALCLGGAGACAVLLYFLMKRIGWKRMVE